MLQRERVKEKHISRSSSTAKFPLMCALYRAVREAREAIFSQSSIQEPYRVITYRRMR